MELLLLLIVAGVIGYFIGRSRRAKSSQTSGSQVVVDAEAKEPKETAKTES
jgi:hypothetical protein